MEERKPLGLPGEYVRRRYIDETVMVFAVEQNVVLLNEVGVFSTISREALAADYIGLDKAEVLAR